MRPLLVLFLLVQLATAASVPAGAGSWSNAVETGCGCVSVEATAACCCSSAHAPATDDPPCASAEGLEPALCACTAGPAAPLPTSTPPASRDAGPERSSAPDTACAHPAPAGADDPGASNASTNGMASADLLTNCPSPDRSCIWRL